MPCFFFVVVWCCLVFVACRLRLFVGCCSLFFALGFGDPRLSVRVAPCCSMLVVRCLLFVCVVFLMFDVWLLRVVWCML